MKTSHKLWIGFGTLTVLLAVFSVASIVSLRSIETRLDAEANISRPRSEAARGLEVHMLRYTLAVSEHLRTGSRTGLKVAATSNAAVREHFANYRKLASTDRQ